MHAEHAIGRFRLGSHARACQVMATAVLLKQTFENAHKTVAAER